MAQQETRPLAICLTETWLKDDSDIKCLSLSSYQLLHTSKGQIEKVWGVAIFVREGLVKTVLHNCSSRICQLLTIKIEFKNFEKNLVLTVVYLKSNTSLSELSKTFEENFEEKNDTQAKTDAFNVRRFSYWSFKNKYFTTIGKTLAHELDPEQKASQKTQASIAWFKTKSAKKSYLWQSVTKKINTAQIMRDSTILNSGKYTVCYFPALTYLVNKCFDNSVFPNCLKKAVIIPLYSNGDPKVAENYRPTSLLPTIGKLIKKLINKKMQNFSGKTQTTEQKAIWV